MPQNWLLRRSNKPISINTLLIGFIFSLCLFGISSAHATEIINQSLDNTTIGYFSDSRSFAQSLQAQSFQFDTATSVGDITVKIFATNDGTIPTGQVIIMGIYEDQAGHPKAGGVLETSTTTYDSTTLDYGTLYNLTFDFAFLAQPDTPYWFVVGTNDTARGDCNDVRCYSIHAGTMVGSPYAEGVPKSYTSDTGWDTASVATSDWTMIVNDVTSAHDINILFPENATTIQDFINFSIHYNTNKTDAHIDLYFNDGTNFYDQYGLMVDPSAGLTLSIAKGYLLPDGVWNLTAKLVSIADGELATDSISFTTSVSGGSGVPTPDCEGGNWIGNAFCDVMVYLFVPNQATFNNFGNLAQGIKNKPPMGYFTSVISALTNLGATATPAFSFNPDDLDAIAPFFTPIRLGLNFILWLIFTIWLYNRLRHLEI